MNEIDDIINAQEEHPDLTEQSSAQIDTKLTSCIAERDSWKEKYMRAQADFDNFTKRIDKERIGWRTSAQATVLQDVLNIVDDFDRAFEQLHKQQSTPDMQTWLAGFDMIRKSFYKFLDTYEIKEISASMPFDPHYHESLMQVDAPDKQSGEIVAILQKGFTFKGQILRPAKVSVAK